MLLFACAPPADQQPDTPATETDDSPVPDSPADTADTPDDTPVDSPEDTTPEDTGYPCPPLEVTAAETTYEGALQLTLTTPIATTSALTWGYETLDYTPTPVTEPTTSHRYLLVGPAPESTVTWRLEALLYGSTCAAEGTWTRPPVERPLPDFVLRAAEPGFQSGWRLAPVSGTPPNVVVFDDAGRIAWNWHPPGGYVPVNAQFDPARMAIVVLLEADDTMGNFGLLVRIPLDQSAEETWQAPDAHHGFTILEDGSFVYLATDTRDFDEQPVSGDALVHVAQDGTRTTLWSTWDDWTPDVLRILAAGSDYYHSSLDWSHANSISLRSDGSYLVSFHALDVVATIEPSGDLRWVLGGQDPGVPADVTFGGSLDETFHWQHSAIEVPGGIALFDNGAGIKGTWSEAAVYLVDEAARTAERGWVYDHDGVQQAYINGGIYALPNGDWLVSWGSEGFFTQVRPDGTLTWELGGPSEEHAAVLGFGGYVEDFGGAW